MSHTHTPQLVLSLSDTTLVWILHHELTILVY